MTVAVFLCSCLENISLRSLQRDKDFLPRLYCSQNTSVGFSLEYLGREELLEDEVEE